MIAQPLRNSQIPPQTIIQGIPPNRLARRWYQKTVTDRAARLHLVCFGGWRKHDTRQQITHRGNMRLGANAPVDGMTRAERRAQHAEIYRAVHKSRSHRITPAQ